MKAETLRKRAWNHLGGKWGTVALIAFVYSLITSAVTALSVTGIGAIAAILIGGPFALSFAIISLSVVRKGNTNFDQLFSGFSKFENSFILYLLNYIFISLWSLLLVIPGIVKYYSYSMGYYIMLDHPELTPNEARKRSIELMNGNKWRLFCLDLSFIGWWILCILTCGILSFWITPYSQAARAEFYEDLVNPNAAENTTPAPVMPAPPAVKEEAAPAAAPTSEEAVPNGESASGEAPASDPEKDE